MRYGDIYNLIIARMRKLPHETTVINGEQVIVYDGHAVVDRIIKEEEMSQCPTDTQNLQHLTEILKEVS